MIYSICSNGRRVSQATIDKELSLAYREKYVADQRIICECCLEAWSTASDHTIAKARCKVLHKTELIWNPFNFVRSCDKCHNNWESFKSGEWVLHKNVIQRLEFLKIYDPEGFLIRIEFTVSALEEQKKQLTLNADNS